MKIKMINSQKKNWIKLKVSLNFKKKWKIILKLKKKFYNNCNNNKNIKIHQYKQNKKED